MHSWQVYEFNVMLSEVLKASKKNHGDKYKNNWKLSRDGSTKKHANKGRDDSSKKVIPMTDSCACEILLSWKKKKDKI